MERRGQYWKTEIIGYWYTVIWHSNLECCGFCFIHCNNDRIWVFIWRFGNELNKRIVLWWFFFVCNRFYINFIHILLTEKNRRFFHNCRNCNESISLQKSTCFSIKNYPDINRSSSKLSELCFHQKIIRRVTFEKVHRSSIVVEPLLLEYHKDWWQSLAAIMSSANFGRM